ncbi:MAG: exo-alpha-sialidase [Chloroflexi bacterium]|nr:exo-alpha-sialidase [Chloroflexota bacterium]
MAATRLLVGTRQGAWIYTADAARRKWTVSEPIMPGWTIYHMAVDTRGATPRLFAAGSHWAWGPLIARSDDGGKTWDQRSRGLGFPQPATPEAVIERKLGSVWQVVPGHPDEPGVVYAGTQPAGLFKSTDGGDTWAPVPGLNDHEYRPFWGPSGGGDSALHSIVIDPRNARRMYVSISTGGTYLTEDGGETWALNSHRVVATTPMAKQMEEEFAKRFPELAAQFEEQFKLPENVDPAAQDEFHKMHMDPKNPDRLWGQAHIGVFRFDEDSAGWKDVTEGLPSFHGFPLAVTRRAPDAVYVVPLAFEEDNFRVAREQFAVWRTRDGGASWQALTDGLPGPHDYQSVYREGLDTDGMDPESVYVGTSNGQVYASADGGDHWQRLPGTLPPIQSVTAATF